MLISVVVPTYRRPGLLERCLNALVAQDFDPQCYEIIVADDGAEERVRSLVQKWARRTQGAPRIMYEAVTRTRGPAGARNKGWRRARGEVIAFTDDDTIPLSDWLTEGWRAMQPDVIAAAGRVRVRLPPGKACDYERDTHRTETAEFVTANCFVTRQALRAVGGFDERFTTAWREDSDLQFRLVEAHGKLVNAAHAIVEHPVRPQTWQQRIRAHRKVLFDALLYKKHPDLYRERIGRSPPWHYYGIVAAIVGVVLGALLESPLLAVTSFGIWLALTGVYFASRLPRGSSSSRHIYEMIATSIAIPVVSVFWRLAGAWRFRVRFL